MAVAVRGWFARGPLGDRFSDPLSTLGERRLWPADLG